MVAGLCGHSPHNIELSVQGYAFVDFSLPGSALACKQAMDEIERNMRPDPRKQKDLKAAQPDSAGRPPQDGQTQAEAPDGAKPMVSHCTAPSKTAQPATSSTHRLQGMRITISDKAGDENLCIRTQSLGDDV